MIMPLIKASKFQFETEQFIRAKEINYKIREFDEGLNLLECSMNYRTK